MRAVAHPRHAGGHRRGGGWDLPPPPRRRVSPGPSTPARPAHRRLVPSASAGPAPISESPRTRSTVLDVSVTLEPRDPAALDSFLGRRQPRPGLAVPTASTWPRASFGGRFGADPAHRRSGQRPACGRPGLPSRATRLQHAGPSRWRGRPAEIATAFGTRFRSDPPGATVRVVPPPHTSGGEDPGRWRPASSGSTTGRGHAMETSTGRKPRRRVGPRPVRPAGSVSGFVVGRPSLAVRVRHVVPGPGRRRCGARPWRSTELSDYADGRTVTTFQNLFRRTAER